MNNKIIELHKAGKSIRDIAEILNIDKNVVFRCLKKISVSGETVAVSSKDETKTETVNSRCHRLDPKTCEIHKETISGVRKLRKCDYNRFEQLEHSGQPYYDCLKF